MNRPYKRKRISLFQKERVVYMALEMRCNYTHIGLALGISPRSVENIMHELRSTGQLRPPGKLLDRMLGRRRALTVIDVDFIVGLVERTPDLYLCEIQHELREVRLVDVCAMTIHNALVRRGFTRKRISPIAIQRDEERRAQYQLRMAFTYTAEQLVFVDEAACNRRTAKRLWGWARIGEQARKHAMYVRGIKYSVLPALSLDGVLYLDIIPRSFNGERFNSFIDGLLDNMNPFPGPNSVIVMDNASIHKSQELRPMIEARGMRLEYLPPYSPDYDPIEEGFSALKAWIRAERAWSENELAGTDPYAMLWEAVYDAMTPEKARGWFRHSGYL